MDRKFFAVNTFGAWNIQVSPFFATVPEVETWCECNSVEDDAILSCVNWQEVRRWQEDPDNKVYFRGTAWEVLS